MADWVSVPLGIDLGAMRLRVAHSEKNRRGELRLRAVVSRDLPTFSESQEPRDDALLASVLEDAVAELRTRERRCVFALAVPHALLRYVKFPKMSWAERLRAARFEVNRWPGFDSDLLDVTVRVHPVADETGTFAVGAASTAVVTRRAKLVRESGLHPIGIDHASCALRRLFRDVEAIVDVGADRATIHAYGPKGPVSVTTDSGGVSVTNGIARELSISIDLAEKRKRILGCAGVGVAEQDGVIASISAAIERLRMRAPIGRIALVGNGGRLPEFVAGLESATGANVEMPVPTLFDTSPYPADVTRMAAPDWSLAVALTTWSIAS